MQPSRQTSRPRRRWLAAFLLWPAWLAAALTAPAHAQDEDNRPGRSAEASKLSGVHVPVDDRANQLIGQAETGIGRKSWKQVVRDLQTALLLYPDYVYEVKTGLYAGVRLYCTERLRSLAPEGKQAWRDQYDEIARGRFQEAIRVLDRDQLIATAERYPLSNWADQAAMVVGMLALESGDPHNAIPWLERVLSSDDPVVARGAMLPLASALSRTGDRVGLERLAARIQQAAGDAAILAGGGAVDAVRQVREWIERLPTGDKSSAPRVGGEPWECFGGDASRTRLMSPALELPPRMWSFPVPAGSQPHVHQREFFIQPYTSGADETVCNLFPAVADGVAYVHNDVQVFALELMSEVPKGNVLWKFPSGKPQMSPSDVIFEDHAIHTCSLADGRLFVNLAWTRREFERQLDWLDVKLPLPNRALIALDAQTGRLLWRLGGLRGGQGEGFAETASFANAPAVAGGDLFVGAVYQANDTNPIEHYVCRVDARTGELRWRSNVCAGFLEMNLFNNPTREAVGSPVTLYRGLALYCSNMGVVSAIDIRTGRVRWLRRYRQYRIGPTRDINAERMERGWANNPLLVQEGRLFVAPTDSPYLYALDAETGREIWSRHRNQYDARDSVLEGERFLLGVVGDSLIVSGEGVLALDVSSGDKRGSWHPQGGSTLMGRGACTAGRVYVPTRNALVRLTVDLKLDKSYKWFDREAGNVVIADGALLSATPRALTAAFSAQAIDQQIAEDLARNPNDPYLRFRVGQNHQKAGRFADAAKCFEDSVRLGESKGDRSGKLIAEGARQALCRLHMDAGRQAWDRKDRKAGIESFARAKTWALDDAAVADICFTVAALLLEARMFPETLAQLQEVIDRTPDVPIARGTAREYAREKIRDAIQAGGREPYAPYEEKARALLALAEASHVPDDYLRVVQRYPNSVAAEESLLRLAHRFFADGQFEDARQRLEQLIENRPTVRMAEARLLLVLCHEQRGAWTSARAGLQELLRRWPDARVDAPGGAVLVKDFVQERLRQPEYEQMADAGRRRELSGAVREVWTWSDPGSNDVRMLRPVGAASRAAEDFVFVTSRDLVRALHRKTGEVAWQARVERSVRLAVFFDQNLLVCCPTAVYAIEAATGREQWRAQVGEYYVQDARLADNILLVTMYQRVTRDLMRLVALDAGSGRELWGYDYRGEAASAEGILTSDENVIVPVSPKELRVLDREKGTDVAVIALPERYQRLLLAAPGRLVVMSSRKSLACYDVRSGKPLWQQATGLILANVLLANQNAIAFVERMEDNLSISFLVVMDPETGKRKARAQISDGDFPNGNGAIDDELLYITFRDRSARDRIYVSAYSLQSAARVWTCAREGGGSPQLYSPILNGTAFVLNGAVLEQVGGRWSATAMLVRRNDGAKIQELSVAAVGSANPTVVIENGVLGVMQGSQVTAYIAD